MISKVIGNCWRELELLAERLTPLRTYWRYGHSEREEVVVLACTSMCLTAEMYREIDLGANFVVIGRLQIGKGYFVSEVVGLGPPYCKTRSP